MSEKGDQALNAEATIYDHQPDPLYVPICEVCGKPIHLNDAEQWEHGG